MAQQGPLSFTPWFSPSELSSVSITFEMIWTTVNIAPLGLNMALLQHAYVCYYVWCLVQRRLLGECEPWCGPGFHQADGIDWTDECPGYSILDSTTNPDLTEEYTYSRWRNDSKPINGKKGPTAPRWACLSTGQVDLLPATRSPHPAASSHTPSVLFSRKKRPNMLLS